MEKGLNINFISWHFIMTAVRKVEKMIADNTFIWSHTVEDIESFVDDSGGIMTTRFKALVSEYDNDEAFGSSIDRKALVEFKTYLNIDTISDPIIRYID